MLVHSNPSRVEKTLGDPHQRAGCNQNDPKIDVVFVLLHEFSFWIGPNANPRCHDGRLRPTNHSTTSGTFSGRNTEKTKRRIRLRRTRRDKESADKHRCVPASRIEFIRAPRHEHQR